MSERLIFDVFVPFALAALAVVNVVIIFVH